MIKCGRPRKGEELLSRDRLLDTAVILFLDYGYGNLSLETIARDARVSMRTIYSQFGGKAGLFGAVIRRCSDQFVACLSAEQAEECLTEEALLSFARQFLYRLTRPDVVRMRAVIIGESLRFPDLAAQYYEQGPQRTLDQLAKFFKRQQQTGDIAPVDPHFLAGQLLSALRSERFQRLQLGLEPTPDEAEIDLWARQSVELFLHGCSAANITRPIAELPSR
ncbi:TetR/AcrR family transcriptional regulator [Candidatus Methylobacter favarea]|uniref:TetR/AcrR family transcriptional regulator n=1 Tax=Candidatus Methylobacter favarea TaxID=2707345 RepID=UPI00157D4ACF|nr:TetR/AcrR family transcriptional regulator [Candidatus Methylobacter favarea]